MIGFGARTFLACVLVLAGSARLSAQTTSGSIVGVVTDATGAAISQASVTVTNLDTGIASKFVTDATGSYVATPLSIGRYSVAVEAKGFKKALVPVVTVDVLDRVRVDLQLRVGDAATESVDVHPGASLLESETSALGQLVDSKRIVDLPLNGRYFTRLAVLTAGTAPTPSGALDAVTGGFSANGVRPYENDYILDGVDNNSLSPDLSSQSSFVIGPPPDAIAEFRVQTNSMSAEFGRSGGGVLNVNIKSGTNQPHGTLYEFLRNSAMDAKNYFDASDAPIPPFKQNQFGFSFGGPVEIPKMYHGRDKTFFFADYQGTRVRSSQTVITTVPPEAWRTGDFSGFQTIYDPATTVINPDGTATRQPFSGNQILASRFDPVAKQLIDLFPAPNLPGSVSSAGVANNYLANPASISNVNQFDIRIDHRISNRDSLFGRFSFSNQNASAQGPIPPPLDSAIFFDSNYLNYSRNLALSETHVFTPHLVNELRFGYNHARIERLQFNSNENISAQFKIPGIPFKPGYGGLPFLAIEDLTSFGSFLFLPTIESQDVYQIVEGLSWVKGRNTLRFGAELRPRVNFSFSQSPQPRGSFGFNGNASRDPNNLSNTGLGTADFMLGLSYDQSGLTGINTVITDHFQQPGYFAYVQNDFKVSNKITLNLGVRYEFVAHVTEENDAMANFNLSNNTLEIVAGNNTPLPPTFYPQIPVTHDASRTLVPNNKLDFMPRIGLAYSLTPHTVIRSGYGIFYSSYEAGPLSFPNAGNNPPFFALTRFDAPSVVTPNPIVSQLSNGFPAHALTDPSSFSLFSIDPHLRNPYVQHWNLAVQHELGWNSVLEVAYAGSKGTRLYEFRNANEATPTASPNSDINSRRPFPFVPTDFFYWCSCGSSAYHSLQAKAEKRLSNGMSFLGAYTFSKAIDEQSSASLGFFFYSTQASPGGFWRDQRYPWEEKGPADFNVAHRFVYSMNYDLPFGRGKAFAANINPFLDNVIGGWELQTVTSLQTGEPRTVVANIGLSNSDGENRPDSVPGVSWVPKNQGPLNWINPAAFTTAADGTFGNAGRNTISAAGIIGVDVSLFKVFNIWREAKLQFRSEFFNLVNHPNFQAYSLNTTWGQASFGQYSAAAPARQIQIALKVIF